MNTFYISLQEFHIRFMCILYSNLKFVICFLFQGVMGEPGLMGVPGIPVSNC